MRTNLEIAQGTVAGLIASRKRDHDNYYVNRDIDTVTACVKAIQSMPEDSTIAKDAFTTVINIRRIYGMPVDDLKYQIMWINKASGRLCNTRVSDRETAMRVAEKMKESPETYDEILVTVRGDNGYFQPLD